VTPAEEYGDPELRIRDGAGWRSTSPRARSAPAGELARSLLRRVPLLLEAAPLEAAPPTCAPSSNFPTGQCQLTAGFAAGQLRMLILLQEMRMKKIYEKPVLVKRERLSAVTAFMGPSSGGKPPM
jgi:hypothetical protein